jgi:ribonuclease HII
MELTVGIDEVGRGCLAGPLVAGAVVLGPRINGLRDSKLLTRQQREALAARIERKALAFGVGWATAAEIDQLGLTAANALAMQRALDLITLEYDHIIIDGSYNYLRGNPKAQTLIKADQKIKSVSAASIIAKVARDNYMRQQAELFPNYHFHRHVGYGTRLHREALQLHGICELHRLSFMPIKALAG